MAVSKCDVKTRRRVNVALQIHIYQDDFPDKELKPLEESFVYKDPNPVSGINIDGLHDVELNVKVGTHFGSDSLRLEDIVQYRPTTESRRFRRLHLIIWYD